MPPKKKSKTEDPEGEEVKEEATEEKAEKKEDAEAKAEDEADAKKEEEEEEKKEEKKEPEKPKELEEDAPEDSRPKIKGAVAVSEVDTTLDVMVSGGGSVLTSFSNGAFQHLLSGARATTGCKAGRYYWEMKILERKGEANLRIGLSKANGSLFLGESKGEHVFWEAQDTWRNKVVGILVNLDETHPNAFTTSLFIDGVRAKAPKAIPEGLKGQVLFPTITFRNLTLALNFGQMGGPIKPLPFKVPMFSALAKADSGTSDIFAPTAKNEVVVVVGLPDEGVFDYADKFLEDNPSFIELSNRSLMRWCERSGLRQYQKDATSRDFPHFNFGVPAIDNKSGMWGIVNTLARFSKRNFLVVEVRDNLQKETREATLKKFTAPFFQKSAIVCVGEPPADFKSWVHKKIMEKYEKDKERKQAQIDKQKAKAAGKGKKRNADGEVKEEEKKDEEKDEKPIIPVPEIGDSVWFMPKPKSAAPDVSKKALSSFASFCFPTKDEGFSKVNFAWNGEAAAADHLRKWQLEKKATTVIQDLKASDWFKEKLKAFTEPRKEWKKKQMDWRQKQKKDGKKLDDDEEGDDIELSTVTDVNEADENGTPVYARFAHEDWTLLQYRCDLHLLAHGFQHDVEDPDRPGVPEEHIAHYFNIYIGKTWSAKGLGCDDLQGVCALLKDTAYLDGEKSKVLKAKLPVDTTIETILKMVEETRRSRVRRIEAGDESARLKIPKDFKASSGGKGKDSSKGDSKGHRKSSGKGTFQKRPVPIVQESHSKWQRTSSWNQGGKSGGKSGGHTYSGGGYGGGKSNGKSYGKSNGPSYHRPSTSYGKGGGGRRW